MARRLVSVISSFFLDGSQSRNIGGFCTVLFFLPLLPLHSFVVVLTLYHCLRHPEKRKLSNSFLTLLNRRVDLLSDEK